MEVLNKKLQVRNLGKSFDSKKVLDNITFDVYEGEQIAKGKKSVAYTMTFRAKDRTLETSEVDGIIAKILKELGKLGIEIRA